MVLGLCDAPKTEKCLPCKVQLAVDFWADLVMVLSLCQLAQALLILSAYLMLVPVSLTQVSTLRSLSHAERGHWVYTSLHLSKARCDRRKVELACAAAWNCCGSDQEIQPFTKVSSQTISSADSDHHSQHRQHPTTCTTLMLYASSITFLANLNMTGYQQYKLVLFYGLFKLPCAFENVPIIQLFPHEGDAGSLHSRSARRTKTVSGT